MDLIVDLDEAWQLSYVFRPDEVVNGSLLKIRDAVKDLLGDLGDGSEFKRLEVKGIRAVEVDCDLDEVMDFHGFYLCVDPLHQQRSDPVFGAGKFRVETEGIEEEADLVVGDGGLSLFVGRLKCLQQLAGNGPAFVAVEGADLVVSVDEISDIVLCRLAVLDQSVVALHQHFLELEDSIRNEASVLDVAQH